MATASNSRWKTHYRSHQCGEISADHVGQSVSICGWVHKNRNLGGLHFKDLRDKYGIIQLNFINYPDELPDTPLESVIRVQGRVVARPEKDQNAEMKTGAVEIHVSQMQILSAAQSSHLAFLPSAKLKATEDLRLKYRYLDLRSEKLQQALQLRSDLAYRLRSFLIKESFVEVETPLLFKSTPEGARDFLVPSRMNPGRMYALPQSPQILKQLLMIGGTDRYFQIVKCFRDEDLRADRQPEFTQLDIEASFVNESDMYQLANSLCKVIFSLEDDFVLPQMTYKDAMDKYGTDKPDLRFQLEHVDFNQIFAESNFQVFKDIILKGGLVKGIFVSESMGASKISRKDIDNLTEIVSPFGLKGVAWLKLSGAGADVTGPLAKFCSPEDISKIGKKFNDNNGIAFFVGSEVPGKTHQAMDALRRHFGKKLDLITTGDLKLVFINQFPLFEWDSDLNRLFACHHPFTSPLSEDMDLFLTGSGKDLSTLRAQAYDIVGNGHELGGGSIRIFNASVQEKMFQHLSLSESDISTQFGFFNDALKTGVPPHGGMALGLDRLVMVLMQTDNIRDVIAFPKTASGFDLMASCPSEVSLDLLAELHLSSTHQETNLC